MSGEKYKVGIYTVPTASYEITRQLGDFELATTIYGTDLYLPVGMASLIPIAQLANRPLSFFHVNLDCDWSPKNKKHIQQLYQLTHVFLANTYTYLQQSGSAISSVPNQRNRNSHPVVIDAQEICYPAFQGILQIGTTPRAA